MSKYGDQLEGSSDLEFKSGGGQRMGWVVNPDRPEDDQDREVRERWFCEERHELEMVDEAGPPEVPHLRRKIVSAVIKSLDVLAESTDLEKAMRERSDRILDLQKARLDKLRKEHENG